MVIPRAKDGTEPTEEIGSTGSIMLSSFMLGQNVCTAGWDDWEGTLVYFDVVSCAFVLFDLFVSFSIVLELAMYCDCLHL